MSSLCSDMQDAQSIPPHEDEESLRNVLRSCPEHASLPIRRQRLPFFRNMNVDDYTPVLKKDLGFPLEAVRDHSL